MKNQVLLQEIVFKHHPEFQDELLQDRLLKLPSTVFNVEHLVELTIAHKANTVFVDEAHYDLADLTEVKTASVSPNPKKPGTVSHRLEISNIVSPGGQMKTGDIRLVLYNAVNNNLRYYYIPNSNLRELGINIHPTTKIGRIFATWNREKDRCNKLDPFEVNDFEALCSI